MAFDYSTITDYFNDLKQQGATAGSVVGIDIGSSSVKLVQIKLQKDDLALETYGELQLGPYGNLEAGQLANLPPLKITEALIDIIREATVTAVTCGVSIPYTSSFATVLDIPTLDPEIVARSIPAEAKKYVPVSLNEVLIDWFPVTTDPDSKTTKILLVATHKAALKRSNLVISNLDLENKISEIEFFSTIRAAVSKGDNLVAILDLGANLTKLYIVNQGIVHMTHATKNIGGADITNQLAVDLGVDFPTAEKTKCAHGLIPHQDQPAVYNSISAFVDPGFREIDRILKNYEAHNGIQVEKVILSGGGAMMRNMPSYASNQLQREVVLANPFDKVFYPAFLEDTLRDVGVIFTPALGVALRAALQKID